MLSKEDRDKFTTLFKDNEYVAFFDYVYNIAFDILDWHMKEVLANFASSNNKIKFYINFLVLDEDSVKTTFNCNNIVAQNIIKFSTKLKSITSDMQAFEVFRNRNLVEELFPLIVNHIKDLNVRQIHFFETYFTACNNSVCTLYYHIYLSDHTSIKYPGLGVESSAEMYKQMLSLKSLIEEMAINHNLANTQLRNHKWENLGIIDSNLEQFNTLARQLGYPPLFKAISLILNTLDSRMARIAKHCFNIYKTPQMFDMIDVATMNSISRERVRQLRGKIFDDLVCVLQKINENNLLLEYSYDISSEYELTNISLREDVAFNQNFILWVLSFFNKNYQLIGNVERAFIKYPATKETLFLVPQNLNQVFDFDAFINKINEKVQGKRFYDERIDLDIFVKNLCSQNVEDNTFYEIVKECRKMLERGFSDIIQNSQICLKQNARKSIPDLIEEIIRNNNGPMSSQQIAETINSLYPNLKQTPKKIGPNALRNLNIVPISRTSTYTLVEWNTSEKRGGTIRELAIEYLNGLPEPIAPITDICAYISDFRENVKESNVKTNLLADSSNKFSLYYKANVIYMGYSDYHFDVSFKIIEKRQGRRSFNESINHLEEFIKTHGHFPFSSGVDAEEIRLSRFYAITKAKLKKGNLATTEAAELERIDEQYAKYKTKKERGSWNDHLENFISYITLHDQLPHPSSLEYKWFEENKELFHKGMLNTEQNQAFALVDKIVNRMTK